MTRRTIPREIHVDDGDGPVTIYVGEGATPAGNSGCLLIILVGILLIVLLSLTAQEGAPLGALMVRLLVF